MDLFPERIPTLLAALGSLAIAIWVLVVRPGNRLHQAFFLLMWCIAWSRGLLPWAHSLDSIAMRVLMYPLMAIGPTAAYFAYRFHLGHRRGARTHLWIPILCLATYLAGISYYVARPGAFLGPPWHVLRLPEIETLAYAGLAFLMAWSARRTPPSMHRRSLHLLALGFALFPSYEIIIGLSVTLPLTYGPWQLVDLALNLSSLMLLAALVVIWTVDGGHLGRIALLGLAAASGVVMYVVSQVSPSELIWRWGVAAAWLLIGHAAMGYALMHCRNFTMDLRVKAAMKAGAVATMFALTFLIVTESLESLFDTESRGLSITVGVLIALAFQPLQRAAQRLLDVFMPGVQKDAEYDLQRRLQLYMGALEDAAADGRLSESEERNLLRLQTELRLDMDEAVFVERSVLDGHTIAEYRAV